MVRVFRGAARERLRVIGILKPLRVPLRQPACALILSLRTYFAAHGELTARALRARRALAMSRNLPVRCKCRAIASAAMLRT